MFCANRCRNEARGASEGSLCIGLCLKVRPFRKALAIAGGRFALGDCLNRAFFRSPKMKEQVRRLAAATKFDATVAYTLPMAQYAPQHVPLLLDLVDVDSEKWFQYGRTRTPGLPLHSSKPAACAGRKSSVPSAAARDLLGGEAGSRFCFAEVRTECGFRLHGKWRGFGSLFDPEENAELPALRGRKFIVFVGTMDYHPNIDGARWFARNVFPEVRRMQPAAEFLVVGNKPAREVLELAKVEGVVVTGGVEDVRPYIAQARAVVAPL